MDLSKFSESAQAELGSLFGKEPAPEPEVESSADEETPELESEIDEESSPDVEADEDGDSVDDSDEEAAAPEDDIEYIKADGKKVKIDFNDRENIKRVFSMAAGARKWQAERDALKASEAEITSSYNQLKETMDFLEGIKDNDEEIFEAVTGKNLNEKFKEWADEQNMISGMTESEKGMYLSNQDHQKRIRDVEKREKQLQAKLEEAERRESEANDSKQTSLANPAFFKYNFDSELGDSQLENRLNKMLWSEAREELSAFDNVTPDMVNETFERISNQVRKTFSIKSKEAVKKTVKAKRGAVKAKAQKMAVAEPKTSKKDEITSKLKSGDFAGLLSGEYDLNNY